jgi:hypothetical protein
MAVYRDVFPEAVAFLEEGKKIAKAIGDECTESGGLMDLSFARLLMDDLEAARDAFAGWGMITAFCRIGFAALALGDGAEARERFGEVLQACARLAGHLARTPCTERDRRVPRRRSRGTGAGRRDPHVRDGSRAAPPSYAFAARPALDRLEAELPQEGLTAAREAAAATTLEELERTARQSV